jgi:PBP1b-binding outer membrane lipoprotein LpoB
MSNRTISKRNVRTGPRWLLGGVLLGAMALIGGCVSTPAPTEVRTTTTERTTTQENVPVVTPGTSVTTTRTQQYTP